MVPVTFGEEYSNLDPRSFRCQMDLVYLEREFYLCCVREVQEDEQLCYDDVLGIDLGIVNLATTSDGEFYSGEECEKTRTRYSTLRADLQKAGTKSAKRHLRKMSHREKNFKKHQNHCISKVLVTLAEGTERAIALEDLTHIRSRTTVKKAQWDRYSKWAFRQLRFFIGYKAKIAGVPVLLVNPRGTSRKCSACGYEDKWNRKSQNEFVCRSCGHAEEADVNAAKNIRGAAVATPIVVRHAELLWYEVGTARSWSDHGQAILYGPGRNFRC